jgi:biopolymer transport protein ExbB
LGNWWSQSVQFFDDGGIFMWPLLACAVLGLVVIVWKFISLTSTSGQTRKLLEDVDGLIANHRLEEAKARCRESDTPVAQMSRLEQGLVWLATVANVAPLLGFLGTVAGMIIAFGAIELAGEVDATLVAGGIKVALITTAAGLTIAIPVNVAHNYFVSKIDSLVIEMEETSQNLIETLHEIERAPAARKA